jgi:hypothetical protein
LLLPKTSYQQGRAEQQICTLTEREKRDLGSLPALALGLFPTRMGLLLGLAQGELRGSQLGEKAGSIVLPDPASAWQTARGREVACLAVLAIFPGHVV